MHSGSHHMALLMDCSSVFFSVFFFNNLAFIRPNYRLIRWRRVWSKQGRSKWKTWKEWMASIKFGWNIYYSLLYFLNYKYWVYLVSKI